MRRWLCGIALAACTAASAHGDWQPKHGGRMNDGGETSFELLARGRNVTLYVEDHGTELSTQGAAGILTITRGAARYSTPLRPKSSNQLRATSPTVLRPGDRVLARVVLANGSVAAGRFELPK